MDKMTDFENVNQKKSIVDYEKNGLFDVLTKSSRIFRAVENYLEAQTNITKSDESITYLGSLQGKLEYMLNMFNPKSLSGILEKWGLDETEQKDMSNISKYGGLGLLKTFGYVILAIFGGGATIIGVFMSGLVFSFLSVIIGLVGIVLLVFGMRGFLNQMLKPLIVIFKERISKYKTIAEQSLKDVGGSIEMV